MQHEAGAHQDLCRVHMGSCLHAWVRAPDLVQAIAQPGPWKSHRSLSAFREANQWWMTGQAKFLIWDVALGPHEQGQHSQDLLVIPGLLDNRR